MQGEIIAVSRNGEHKFSKENQPVIELIAGLGVRDDAHAGVTVKHRVRVREDPSRPNLRQVHLIHSELFEELARPDTVSIPARSAITSRHGG